MPTILTMLGLEDKIPAGLRGQNAGHAILENRDGEIGHALYHHTTISRGFKDDRYTFVIHHEQDNKTLPLEAVLIDDEKDPYQMENIAEKEPEIVGFKDDRYTFVIHHEQDNKTLPLEAVLIDDEKDPYQMENIAEKEPEIVKKFAEKLAGLLEECSDLEAVLIDDEKDPYQMENIAEKEPEIVKKFAEKLAGLLEECSDPFAEEVREFLKTRR